MSAGIESQARREQDRNREQAISAHSVGTITVTAAYGCAISSSWTGVKVLGLPACDLMLLLFIAFTIWSTVLGRYRLQIRWWMISPVLAGAMCLIVETFFPASSFALDGSLAVFARLVAATFAIAVTFGSVVGGEPVRLPLRIASAWLIGVTISALVASVGDPSVLGLQQFVVGTLTTRAAGLTVHPNSLACSLVVALPIAIWGTFFYRHLVTRALALASLLAIFYALTLADSRAGFIVGVPSLTIAATLAVIFGTRGFARMLAGVVLIAGISTVVTIAMRSDRLVSGALGADQSTFLREAGLDAGWSLFQSSPLLGNGLGWGASESVPVLLLSSGGIVFFLGYYCFAFGCVGAIWRRRYSPLAVAGLISAISGLMFGVFNNGAFERYLFVVPVVCAFMVGSCAIRQKAYAK